MSGYARLPKPVSRRLALGLPPNLTEAEREAAREWRRQGVSVAGIARRLACHVQTVHRLIRADREGSRCVFSGRSR